MWDHHISPPKNIYLLSFLVFTTHSMLLLSVPLLLHFLSVSPAEIGIVIASGSAVTGAMAIPLGILSDRFGRKAIFSVGLLSVALGVLMLSISKGPIDVLAAFSITSVGIGAMEPTLSTSLGDTLRADRLGRSYGTFSATLQAGTVVGPVTAGSLIPAIGYETAFLASLIPLAPALFLGLGLPGRVARNTVIQHRNQPRLSVLLRNRRLIVGWISLFLGVTLWRGLGSTFPPYCVTVGLDSTIIGAIMSVAGLTTMLVRIPLGSLLDKAGRSFLFNFVGLLLGAVMVILIGYSASPLILAILLMMMHVGIGLSNMTASTMVVGSATSEARGLAMGVHSTFRSAGAVVGPTLMGSIATSAGFSLGFGYTGGIVLAATLLVGLIYWTYEKKS